MRLKLPATSVVSSTRPPTLAKRRVHAAAGRGAIRPSAVRDRTRRATIGRAGNHLRVRSHALHPGDAARRRHSRVREPALTNSIPRHLLPLPRGTSAVGYTGDSHGSRRARAGHSPTPAGRPADFLLGDWRHGFGAFFMACTPVGSRGCRRLHGYGLRSAALNRGPNCQKWSRSRGCEHRLCRGRRAGDYELRVPAGSPPRAARVATTSFLSSSAPPAAGVATASFLNSSAENAGQRTIRHPPATVRHSSFSVAAVPHKNSYCSTP